jgi:hypothetical protein
MLLCSIVTKRSPKNNEKDEEVNKRSSKNYHHETKNENSSFQDTHMTENKTSMGRKRKKVDHMEGEFKKIKPSSFDGESRTCEEVEAWILDINTSRFTTTLVI